jgi:hypothetical protein
MAPIPRIKLDMYLRAECVIQVLKKRIQKGKLRVEAIAQIVLYQGTASDVPQRVKNNLGFSP